jgi:hypothetical protein
MGPGTIFSPLNLNLLLHCPILRPYQVPSETVPTHLKGGLGARIDYAVGVLTYLFLLPILMLVLCLGEPIAEGPERGV